MKILFIAPDVFRQSGGIARYCRLTCKALSDSDQIKRIDVVSLHDSTECQPDQRYFSPSKGDYYSLNSNVKSFVRKIFWLMLTRKYDIYLVGHINFASLVWLCRMFSSYTPLVPLVYGIEVWGKRNWFRRIGMFRASLLIAISRFTRDKMAISNNVSIDKVRVLYNCFDPCLKLGAQALTNAPIKLEHPNLVTVSRISIDDRYKGHDKVIRALSQVREKVQNIHYYIVGRGDWIPELRMMVNELGLDANVHFLGFVSDNDLTSIYKQCDLFVMPSRKEGFGYVFAEAMAYGKPIVAGNRDATVEVVVDGETGLLVDPLNCNDLAAAITALITDRKKREMMGERGAEIVSKKFSFDEFQQTLIMHLLEAARLAKAKRRNYTRKGHR